MINFKDFSASDDWTSYINKLNYNFSQINVYGGGPRGPQGDRGIRGAASQGKKGDTGPQGPKGLDGKDGANVIQWNRTFLNLNDLPFESLYPNLEESIRIEKTVDFDPVTGEEIISYNPVKREDGEESLYNSVTLGREVLNNTTNPNDIRNYTSPLNILQPNVFSGQFDSGALESLIQLVSRTDASTMDIGYTYENAEFDFFYIRTQDSQGGALKIFNKLTNQFFIKGDSVHLGYNDNFLVANSSKIFYGTSKKDEAIVKIYEDRRGSNGFKHHFVISNEDEFNSGIIFLNKYRITNNLSGTLFSDDSKFYHNSTGDINLKSGMSINDSIINLQDEFIINNSFVRYGTINLGNNVDYVKDKKEVARTFMKGPILVNGSILSYSKSPYEADSILDTFDQNRNPDIQDLKYVPKFEKAINLNPLYVKSYSRNSDFQYIEVSLGDKYFRYDSNNLKASSGLALFKITITDNTVNFPSGTKMDLSNSKIEYVNTYDTSGQSGGPVYEMIEEMSRFTTNEWGVLVSCGEYSQAFNQVYIYGDVYVNEDDETYQNGTEFLIDALSTRFKLKKLLEVASFPNQNVTERSSYVGLFRGFRYDTGQTLQQVYSETSMEAYENPGSVERNSTSGLTVFKQNFGANDAKMTALLMGNGFISGGGSGGGSGTSLKFFNSGNQEDVGPEYLLGLDLRVRANDGKYVMYAHNDRDQFDSTFKNLDDDKLQPLMVQKSYYGNVDKALKKDTGFDVREWVPIVTSYEMNPNNSRTTLNGLTFAFEPVQATGGATWQIKVGFNSNVAIPFVVDVLFINARLVDDQKFIKRAFGFTRASNGTTVPNTALNTANINTNTRYQTAVTSRSGKRRARPTNTVIRTGSNNRPATVTRTRSRRKGRNTTTVISPVTTTTSTRRRTVVSGVSASSNQVVEKFIDELE